jgi:hypothetical protein
VDFIADALIKLGILKNDLHASLTGAVAAAGAPGDPVECTS